MTADSADLPGGDDPNARLERAFIDEFLRNRGLDAAALDRMPADRAKALMREASMYAAAKLTEVEARAHFVHDLRGGHG